MKDSIIQVKNLRKVYPGVVETVALKEISIEIKKEGITAIIGQSGSGKSTLLNLLGILDTPTSGEIIINKQNVSTMTEEERTNFRNASIGFVFQSHYLLPEFSVLENVLMPSLIRDQNTKHAIERAESLLELVGIAEQKDKAATAISGGQKQRTAIARALMNNPQIVLADEPTGNLDSETSEIILNLFEEINQEQSTTFVIITHDDRVADRADRIVELRDGVIIKDSKKS